MGRRFLFGLMIGLGLTAGSLPAFAQGPPGFPPSPGGPGRILFLSGVGNGSFEAPAVPTPTGAWGRVECALNLDTLAGNCRARVWNIPSGVTASHIHVGQPGVAGPIIFPIAIATQISNDVAINFTVGRDNFRSAGRATGVEDIVDAFQAAEGGLWYFNIHTNERPAGEIRVQLRRNVPNQ